MAPPQNHKSAKSVGWETSQNGDKGAKDKGHMTTVDFEITIVGTHPETCDPSPPSITRLEQKLVTEKNITLNVSCKLE
jgi:hypothetical protein